MEPLRIAVCLHCFHGPLKQRLQAAASTGAAGVQIDVRSDLKPAELTETGRRQFLRHLAELGLSVASLSFPTRSPLYEPDRLEARLEAARRAMQFAWQLKSRVVTFRTGRIPADRESDQYAMLRGVLNDLARHANRTGVTPAITTSGDSPDVLLPLLSDVTEGPIGVNFDPAALVLAGHDPSGVLSAVHGYLAHVVVRDAVQEFEGSGVEVPVGRGEVQWDECLALLDEADYAGWLTVDRTQGDDKPGDVARAVRYLQQVRPV